MTTGIKPSGEVRDPVFQDRVRFVYQEGRNAGAALSPEVCRVFAAHPGDIQELKARVRKVIETIHTRKEPITSELVSELLRDRAKQKGEPFSPLMVLQAVAEHFGIEVFDLQGPARSAHIALARQAAMLLLRDLSGLSSTKVGERLGRDHSTVLWGQKAAEERRGGDRWFWQDLEEIKARLLRT